MMELSPPAIEQLCELEGFRECRYQDAKGKWTIGFGHCIEDGDCIPEPLTREGATELLLRDIRVAVEAVEDFVKVPLTQGQFDALVMFTYNVGRGNLAHSTLLRLLNLGYYEQVPHEFKRYVYSGGQYLIGLVRRRNAEVARWVS